ncbi:MAG: dienelactone hydrolase family protein [Bacillota bacterium]
MIPLKNCSFFCFDLGNIHELTYLALLHTLSAVPISICVDIKGICENLKRLSFYVISPNLLDRVDFYRNEEESSAYLNFVNEIGFEKASSEIIALAKELRPQFANFYILGFSVGATVAWLCSNEVRLCDGVIGFYGSRIRDYLYLMPKCETLLFFPSKEKSFDPDEIIKILKIKSVLRL